MINVLLWDLKIESVCFYIAVQNLLFRTDVLDMLKWIME